MRHGSPSAAKPQLKPQREIPNPKIEIRNPKQIQNLKFKIPNAGSRPQSTPLATPRCAHAARILRTETLILADNDSLNRGNEGIRFEPLKLEFEFCFGFRTSDFGFPRSHAACASSGLGLHLL